MKTKITTPVISAAIIVIFAGGIVQGANGATCPSTDPTENYNCPLGPTFLLPSWGDIGGWNEAQYYSTIQLGDIDGDGAFELLSRYVDGLQINQFDSDTGQWIPVGNQLGLFSDEGGWGKPQYYSTIQLGDINGDGADELLARSAAGMNTYQWINTTNNQHWALLGQAGDPAFSDKESWDKARFYSTIQLGDVDGDGAEELLARSAAGMNTYHWDESTQAWTLLGKEGDPALSDEAGWDKPQFYSTIQLGDVNGDGAEELLARSAAGMNTYHWDKSTQAWKLLGKGGDPAFSDKAGWDKPQYYSTIQLGDIDGDGAEELLARSPDGMNTYQWEDSSESWVLLGEAGDPAFSDKESWDKSRFYSTIQLGDVDGDGAEELLARSASGINTYQWNDSQQSWMLLGIAANPALADSDWNKPYDYLTIQTANVDGKSGVELLGRGQYGIRTWFFDADTEEWQRYRPYGFQAFTGGEKDALDLLHNFLGFDDTHTVRGIYGTDTPNLLSTNQACIFPDASGQTVEEVCGSGGKLSNPPDTDCDGSPLSNPQNVTAADWTAVACEIYYELEDAILVADHFSELSGITTTLFIQEDSTQSAIIENLKLDSEKKSDGSYGTLFADILKLIGSIATPLDPEIGIPLTVTGNALSTAVGATSSISGSSANFSDKTLAKVLDDVSNFQIEIPASIVNQREFVAEDRDLLSAVAGLVNGRWQTLNTNGILSSSRLGFATWLYKTFLPTLWDKYEITKCKTEMFPNGSSSMCTSPDNGPYMEEYKDDGVDFTALLPKGEPSCSPSFGVACTFSAPPKDLVDKLWGKMASACIYDGSNAGWDYATCDLEIGSEIFGWPFKKVKGDPQPDEDTLPAPGDSFTDDKIRDLRDQLKAVMESNV